MFGVDLGVTLGHEKELPDHRTAARITRNVTIDVQSARATFSRSCFAPEKPRAETKPPVGNEPTGGEFEILRIY